MSRKTMMLGALGLAALGAGVASVAPIRCTVVCDRCVQKYWVDWDQDGYGAGNSVTLPPDKCDATGYATNSDDCDDQRPSIGSKVLCGGGDLCRGVRDCEEHGPNPPCTVPRRCPEDAFGDGKWIPSVGGGCDWSWTPYWWKPFPVISWDQMLFADWKTIINWNVLLPSNYPGVAGRESIFVISLSQPTDECCAWEQDASLTIDCGNGDILITDKMFVLEKHLSLHCKSHVLKVSKRTWGTTVGCVGKCIRMIRVESFTERDIVGQCEPWTWPSTIRPQSDYYSTF